MDKNSGIIALIVMGEGENCSYNEKVAIAACAWNRLKDQKKYKFNDLKKDFYGYNRTLKISNEIERKAFADSVNASFEAYELVKSGEFREMYFFSLKGHKKPTSFFSLNEICFPENFKHNFFRIEVKE